MRQEKGDKIFLVANTLELPENLWASYVENANTTLDNTLTKEEYLKKYIGNSTGFSYHSIIIDKITGVVVGSTSAIPVEYLYFGECLTFGLSCDTFLLESHRKDFTIAYTLFNNLVKYLKTVNIAFILGVPNQFTLYPYLKKIVKWQEIACLATFAQPINLPKLIKLDVAFLNYLYRKTLKVGLYATHYVFGSKNTEPNIYKKNDEGYNPNFLIEQEYKNVIFRYRIIEDKYKIAQIVYFKNKDDSVSQLTLLRVLDYFIQCNLADVAVFIGSLPFKPRILFNLPAKYRKREYYFMGKIIDADKIDADKIFHFNNWSFSYNNLDIN